jgi:Flp pilus assembly protein TadG
MTMKTRSRSRGAVAVEFAVVLPVLAAIALGLIDYGWFFYCDLVATNAAREGARAGVSVMNGSVSKADSAARSYLSQAGIGSLSANVVVTPGQYTIDAPTTISVDITLSVTPIIGFVPTPANAVAHARMMGFP